MNKRGGKKHKKVRKEVDSFIYDKEIKEIDSFLEEKGDKSKKEKVKKKKKFVKGDAVFVIIYIIILLLLLIMTPVYITYSFGETKVLWDNVIWILLYIIIVPISYILIKRNLHRKKETD